MSDGYVAVLVIHLHFPEAHSLKAKRSELNPVKSYLRQKLDLSVAEVDHQDTWQRSALGFAVVSSTAAQVTMVLDEVERYVWSRPGVEVIDASRAWIEEDR